MRVLLVRPDPGNERFGLGPFFRVEPLGLEYVGASLRALGHEPRIVDLRFGGSLARAIRRFRPEVVGISCMHALEYDAALSAAATVRLHAPGAFVVIGGHAAAAFPEPLRRPEVDAICVGDGEVAMPALVQALSGRAQLGEVPGIELRREDGGFTPPSDRAADGDIDVAPSPARDLVSEWRGGYHCLLFKPVWLVETARGCPFRCDFCSVWQLHRRRFRERDVATVVADMEACGDHVFIVDDLFWHGTERSLELARELRRRGVRKRWILVQSRTDLVARHPELLEAWRPLAQDFDIFFGLEAATDEQLAKVTKDSMLSESVQAARIARDMRYGVTGNFLVDPSWGEGDFQDLWDFVDAHGLHRAGYTILTPLPGTDLFRRMEAELRRQPWFKFDMHHALWEPALGAPRFFELYAETWRRSILNLGGRKSLSEWLRQVRFREIPYITKVMLRTQRLMKAGAYLAEHEAHRVPVGSPRRNA